MSRTVRCTCRSYCLTFNPETQSYEGEGELVSKSTAANHRRDDLLSPALDTFTQDVAAQVLSYSPPPEFNNRNLPNLRGSHDRSTTPPEFHNPLDDLYFVLETETTYRCAWAPINHSLVFASDPLPMLSYRRPSASEIRMPNREPYALHPQKPINTVYLENESRLCEILAALERRPVSDVRDRLVAKVCGGLTMMDRHKEAEWNRQRAGLIAHYHGHSIVDTGAHTPLVA